MVRRFIVSTAAAILALITVACITVGPNFVKPEVEVHPRWIEADERFHISADELVDWWHIFDDPVLNESDKRMKPNCGAHQITNSSA